MKNNATVLLILSLCFDSLLAAYITGESMNFTDSSGYIVVKNNGSVNVTVDSVKLRLRPASPFGGSQFMFDTGSYKSLSNKMYGDFLYSMYSGSATEATAVARYVQKASVKRGDSAKVFHVRLGNCWGCLLYKTTTRKITDTVQLTWYFSDASRDSVQSVIELLFGSRNRYILEARPLAHKAGPKRAMLLNGRTVTGNRVKMVRLIYFRPVKDYGKN